MSKKTSTAALDSFRKGQLRNQRRAPRHPAGEERVRKYGSKEVTKERESLGRRRLWFGGERHEQERGFGTAGTSRVILPVILRITFCLAMWTLGAVTMAIAEAQTRERCAVQKISVRRVRAQNLQRSVDAGHETRCRIRSEKIRAIRSIEECANEFHQTDKT